MSQYIPTVLQPIRADVRKKAAELSSRFAGMDWPTLLVGMTLGVVALAMGPRGAAACVDWYPDADGDNFGDVGGVPQEICDDSSPVGAWASNDGDCDDTDPAVHSGAPEICDGKDNDCDEDGAIDEGLPEYTYYWDNDEDGFGDSGRSESFCGAAGNTTDDALSDTPGDCNDDDAGIYPGATEVCNDEDDDCDGLVDEGERATLYLDADGDTYGVTATLTTEYCGPNDEDIDPDVGAWVLVDGDCDDTNVAILPGAPEICDGIDNDCNGITDDGGACDEIEGADEDPIDNDGDGYGSSDEWELDDCDDTNPNIYPGAPEICDDVDNDCDGADDCTVVDGGGYEETECCDNDGDKYSELDGDCDDGDFDVNPEANEVSGLEASENNGIDDDCDGLIDETPKDDHDGDGYTENDGDCNDYDAEIFPGQSEDPTDGVDNNCSDGIDEYPPVGRACSGGISSQPQWPWLPLGLLLPLALFRRRVWAAATLLGVLILSSTACADYVLAANQGDPTVELLFPAEGQRLVAGEDAVALAHVHDEQDSRAGRLLKVYWDIYVPGPGGAGMELADSLSQSVDVSDGGTTTVATLPLSGVIGSWRLDVTARDSDGDEGYAVIWAATVPNENPTGTIVWPAPDATTPCRVGEPFLFLAETWDDHLLPEDLSVTWELFLDGEEVAVVGTVPDANGDTFTIQRIPGAGTLRVVLWVDDGMIRTQADEVVSSCVDHEGGGP